MPDERHEQQHAPLDHRPDRQREPLDPDPQERRDEAEDERPAEHRARGAVERRQARERERERPQAGERVEADEDQRPDAGREQAGNEHDAEHRAAQPGRLEQQERAEQRRARAGARSRRSCPAAAITVAAIGGASRAARRTASTPRPLPMAMSGASGPSTAPKLSVARAASMTPGSWTGGSAPAGLKPSAGECPPVPGSRWIAAATSRPPTREHRHRPPRGRRVVAELVREVAEERLLQLRDEPEEAVGDRRHRHADERREHEQLDVAPRPEERQRDPRARWRAEASSCREGRRAGRVRASCGSDDPAATRFIRKG